MGSDLTLEKMKIDDRLRAVEVHIAGRNEMDKMTVVALNNLTEKVGKQNGRINKLENWKAYILGVAGAIGGFFGGVSLIIAWIKH